MFINDTLKMPFVSESTKNLIKYGSLPVILVGMVFNIAAFVVFSRRQFKNHKIAHYSRFNIVIHCVNLLIHSTFYYFLLRDVDIRQMSTLTCKLFQFVFRSFMLLSSWVEIIITYDRNNSIKLNRFQIKDKRTFKRLTFVCVLLILLLNSPNLAFELVDSRTISNSSSIIKLLGVNETTIGSRKFCIAAPKVHFVRDFLLHTFGIYLPIVVTAYMNINLFRDLLYSTHMVNVNNQFKSKVNYCLFKRRIFKSEINYGLALFAQNILFLLTHLPFVITVLVIMLELFYFGKPLNETNLKRIYFLKMVSLFSLGFFYSSTFFTNVLFNRHFKVELVSIIKRLFNSDKRVKFDATALQSGASVLNEFSQMRKTNV